MSVLIIGANEQVAISEALTRAREQPTPWNPDVAIYTQSLTLKLSERRAGTEEFRAKHPAQSVMLGTYRAAISFEYQPAGLLRHLSVSSLARGKVPCWQVMSMIAEAFGFSAELCASLADPTGGHKIAKPARVWIEEFEGGQGETAKMARVAINVMELEE